VESVSEVLPSAAPLLPTVYSAVGGLTSYSLSSVPFVTFVVCSSPPRHRDINVTASLPLSRPHSPNPSSKITKLCWNIIQLTHLIYIIIISQAPHFPGFAIPPAERISALPSFRKPGPSFRKLRVPGSGVRNLQSKVYLPTA